MTIITPDGTQLDKRWQRVRHPEPWPSQDDVLLDLATLDEAACYLPGHQGRLGVWLTPDIGPEFLQPWLPQLDLVALEFPRFTDGRPYSHARLLRTRLGYRGELRAVGDVRRDQIDFMRRCGFDTFELAEGQEPTPPPTVPAYPALQGGDHDG
ncbi:MAG: DUF934 domain-containing protein [Halomonas sp.]